MKDELSGKIKTKFVGLWAKTYSYFIGDGNKDKKAKGIKKCVIKRKLKFSKQKSCLEATQLDNKTKYLEKNKIHIDSIKKSLKEFTRNKKLKLKSQQMFKSESHNVFTEEINKIALSWNYDKRKKYVFLVETYAYGSSKDWVSKKENTKCNNIIKQYNKWLTLMMLQKKI